MQTGYVKRALKADGKGGLHLDCECGERILIPVIEGLRQIRIAPDAFRTMPMTYVCGKCGIEYDSRGWIVSKP